MKLPHLFHRDPNPEQIGVLRYHQCRCGARRVARAYSNIMGVGACGWPRLIDSHGRPVWDSGWHKPPPAGWPCDGRDEVRIKPVSALPPPPPTWSRP